MTPRVRSLLLRPWIWALLAAIVAGGIFARQRALGPVVPAEVAARRPLEQHLVVTGRVAAPARINIAALSQGQVLRVNVVEGQHVKAGDVLAELDDAEPRAALEQAKAGVAQASARVDQLRRVGAVVASRSLEQAEATLENAGKEVERLKQLAASGAIPAVQLEEAQRAARVAQAQRDAAEAQRTAAGEKGSDSNLSLAALAQARAARSAAEVRLAATRVTALQAGTVLSRSVEVGDVVQPARTLFVVAADGDAELKFETDERNLGLLAVGQRARASADAFPDEAFDAEVARLAPAVDAQRGTVEVTLRVPRPPPYLRPDMTISVDVLVRKEERALAIPAEAVRAPSSPSPWLLVASSGRTVRRDVRLGIRGVDLVEIKDGLAEGEQVLVPGAARIEPGQRVRPAPVGR